MPTAVLRAIRSMPWAIMPEWLPTIEAIALRALDAPSVAARLADGHADRYAGALGAIANMGQRLEGTRTATWRAGVAAIPILGPILPRATLMSDISGGCSLDVAAADLRAAQASTGVERILLVIDSPGGVTTDVAAFAALVASSPKPVTAYVSGQGCSAAYWIASQASEIVLSPTALVGSIGVALSTSVQEAPDQSGRRSIEITSSGAPSKRPDLATEEAQAEIRATVLDVIEREFVADVARGRQTTTKAVLSDFGRGGVLVGRAAVKAGMADRIDSLDNTLTRLGRGKPPAASIRPTAEDLPPPDTLADPPEPVASAPPVVAGPLARTLADYDIDLRRRRARS